MNRIEYTRMYEAEGGHWWYVGLHRLVLTMIRKESGRLGRPLELFDAGCGTGRLVQLMQGEGHRVAGCDISADALRYCGMRGLESVFQADLNSLELEPDRYDVITSIDVLYHTAVIDDLMVMKRLRRGLRPGGLLILNLLAHEYLRSTHDVAVHTRERYTKGDVCARLNAAGFDIESSTYRVSFLFPFIAVFRLLSRFFNSARIVSHDVASDVSMPNRLVNNLLLAVMNAENMVLGLLPLPFGSSVFVVARNRNGAGLDN